MTSINIPKISLPWIITFFTLIGMVVSTSLWFISLGKKSATKEIVNEFRTELKIFDTKLGISIKNQDNQFLWQQEQEVKWYNQAGQNERFNMHIQSDSN